MLEIAVPFGVTMPNGSTPLMKSNPFSTLNAFVPAMLEKAIGVQPQLVRPE